MAKQLTDRDIYNYEQNFNKLLSMAMFTFTTPMCEGKPWTLEPVTKKRAEKSK